MKRPLLLPTFILLVVLIGSTAFAQQAGILGVVKDATGAVLPGVTITATHLDTGQSRVTTTDGQGRYRVARVPAGAYRIHAELPGFQTVVREGVTLTIGMEATINFALDVAGVAETVTVTGESPIVETTTSEVGVTLTKQVIDDIPLNGRNPTDLLLLAPGVAVGRARGGYSISGSLERNNSYTIDGIDNNDDIVGGRRVDLQQDVVREFQLITNQFTAEYGRASGGAVNILTQSGTNEYRGRVNFFMRDDAIQATPYLSKEAGIEKTPFRRLTYGGNFGGPIIRDKTHFFASVEFEDTTDNLEFDLPNINYPAVGPYPAIQGGFQVRERTQDNPRVFGKFTHQFNPDHNLAVTLNYDESSNPIGGCSGTDLTCYEFTGNDFLFIAGWTWVKSANSLNELKVARTKYRYDWVVPQDLQYPFHNRPGIDYGQQSNMPQGRDERHLIITDTFSHIFEAKGDHEMKIGGEINYQRSASFFDSNFGGTYTFDTDRPFDANDLSTYPYRFTQRTGDSTLDRDQNIFAVFLQDNWRVTPDLTLNLGVRYDIEILAKHLRETNQGTMFAHLPGIAENSDYRTDKNNIAPRVGFAWDPWGDGKTSIRGGTGLFYDQIFLNIQGNVYRLGVVPRTVDVTIDDPCYPDPYTTIPGVCGGDAEAAGPSRSPVISSGYERSPYAWNTSIGVQREITQDLAFTVDVVRVRTYQWPIAHDFNPRCTLTGSREGDCTGAIGSDASRPDTDWLALRHYATEGDKWYKALQMSLRKRMSNNYQFQISYTLAKLNENATDFTSDPQSYFHPEREAALSNEDQRHRFVFGGSWLAPGDVRVSGIVTYNNGRPFNISMGTDWNGSGNSEQDRPDSIPTEQNVDVGTSNTRPYNPEGPRLRGADGVLVRNSGVGPNFFTIDLRASKIFRFGGHYSVEVLGEFFNLTNRVNVGQPSGNVRSSQYYLRRLMRGEIADTSTDDPMQAQIGIRFNF